MAGLIVSIVFGSIGIIATLLKVAWMLSGKITSLAMNVDGLTKSVDRLDRHVASVAEHEEEQDRRISALEARVSA